MSWRVIDKTVAASSSSSRMMDTSSGASVPTRTWFPFTPTFYKIHAAPEVLNANAITAQTDVFQTGLTFFRMLIGLDTLRQKFNALDEQAYCRALSDDDLISPSDFPAYIPSRLRRIIQKATHPDLAERYQSALDVRRELEKRTIRAIGQLKLMETSSGRLQRCLLVSI